MRWKIKGRDSRSGEAIQLSIEATTLAEAERLAEYNGLILGSDDREANAVPPPVLPYVPAAARVVERTVVGRPPEYATIVWCAAWIRVVAFAVGIFGAALVLWPPIKALVLVVSQGATAWVIPLSLLDSAYGLLIFLAALVARLVAATAMAISDRVPKDLRQTR